MPRKSFLLLFSLLLIGGACVAQSPKTYRLVDVAETGDAGVVSSDIDIDLTIEMHNTQRSVPPHRIGSRHVVQYRVQTLAQTNGYAEKERRTYTLYHVTYKEPHPEKDGVTLQGKTILLERKSQQTKITPENGPLSPQDYKELEFALRSEGHLLPNRPLAIGDEWTPDSSYMKSQFHTYKDAQMRCKLVQILQFQGHPCARVHLTEDLVSTMGANVSYNAHLQGDSYYALDLRCGLSYAVSGPVTIKGSVARQGLTLDVSGTGTIVLKTFSRWEKRAGRPVSISGENLLNKNVL